jgi:hypothetical protein
LDKLNTVILDSSLTVTSQDTDTIEGFSSNQNYLYVIAPYDNVSWICQAIFKPTNAGDTVGIAAEYLTMTFVETTVVGTQTYYKYQIEFPDAVLGNADANRIDVTIAFINYEAQTFNSSTFEYETVTLAGVSRYDETDEDYNDTTYIAAQLLIDFPDAESGDYVRQYNTETDWLFDGTEWTDQDAIILTNLKEHRSDTFNYTLRGGQSTSRPTHAPTNTEIIIQEINKKINATTVENNYYAKIESDSRYYNVTGDTLSGDMNVNDNQITNVGDGVADGDAVNKGQLDLKEDLSNKVTAFQATPDNTKYPSEKLVKDQLDLKLSILNASDLFKNISFDDTTGIVTVTQFDDSTLQIDLSTLSVARATADGDGNVIVDTYATLTQLANAVSGLYDYKGNVDTYADLPTSGNETGDVYNVVVDENTGNTDVNYAWNGSDWDNIGGSVRLATASNDGLLSSTDFQKLAALNNNLDGKFDKNLSITVQKTDLVDGDLIPVSDSENSYTGKAVTFANLVNEIGIAQVYLTVRLIIKPMVLAHIQVPY